MADDRRNQQVTLGCGTLVIIAFIVAMFSHPGGSNVESEVKHLRSDVRELKQTVETQSAEIRALREKLEKK